MPRRKEPKQPKTVEASPEEYAWMSARSRVDRAHAELVNAEFELEQAYLAYTKTFTVKFDDEVSN